MSTNSPIISALTSMSGSSSFSNKTTLSSSSIDSTTIEAATTTTASSSDTNSASLLLVTLILAGVLLVIGFSLALIKYYSVKKLNNLVVPENGIKMENLMQQKNKNKTK